MEYIKNQENLDGKIVLLRLDLNVPIKNGIITDQTRIDKILPVIKFLLEKKSKILQKKTNVNKNPCHSTNVTADAVSTYNHS